MRHFLACLSKDAEGEETIVNIEVNKEKVTFKFVYTTFNYGNLKGLMMYLFILLFLSNVLEMF